MAVRDFPLCSLQRVRYANNKIKKVHMETVWARPCIGWIGITHRNLIYMKFGFSVISHCLWCITEWNSSSWNSLFCLFLNFKVKHIHTFSLEQQILKQSIREKNLIPSWFYSFKCCGSIISSSIHNFFFFQLFRKYPRIGGVLPPSAPICLWANPAWNLGESLWEIRGVRMTGKLPYMWVP